MPTFFLVALLSVVLLNISGNVHNLTYIFYSIFINMKQIKYCLHFVVKLKQFDTVEIGLSIWVNELYYVDQCSTMIFLHYFHVIKQATDTKVKCKTVHTNVSFVPSCRMISRSLSFVAPWLKTYGDIIIVVAVYEPNFLDACSLLLCIMHMIYYIRQDTRHCAIFPFTIIHQHQHLCM